ncbi:methyltransferase [Catenovulum sp. 2E275]|uniref:methyltransferase n=1 Tax=Catenovulum sp. 2E275 TaxID=2980497 RepID=UPI0021CE3B16|nr:methyltransferase [Catenovulum sp. 2E275]MCU4675583.1 methyltransferase [Catenovulum sp. 2E275]
MSTLSPASQLILKHLSEKIDKQTLIIDPLEAQDLAHPDFLSCEVWSFRDLQLPNTMFIWPEKPNGQYHQAIVFFPKAKEKAKWLLSQLAEILPPEANIYLVGENKGGIKTCQKVLADQLINIHKQASGKHCLLYSAQPNPNATKPAGFNFHQYTIEQKSVNIANLPGVFSFGELDKGTELLLSHLPAEINGRVLDFACGCGVIGAFIAKHYPNTLLSFSDIDALAIDSTRETLKQNQLTGELHLSNGLKKISSKYKYIFTNPPFHTGLKIDYYISEAFIKECGQQLESGGKLYLVANRFLKYPQILQNHFDLVEVIAEDNKFKLYCAYNR